MTGWCWQMNRGQRMTAMAPTIESLSRPLRVCSSSRSSSSTDTAPTFLHMLTFSLSLSFSFSLSLSPAFTAKSQSECSWKKVSYMSVNTYMHWYSYCFKFNLATFRNIRFKNDTRDQPIVVFTDLTIYKNLLKILKVFQCMCAYIQIH